MLSTHNPFSSHSAFTMMIFIAQLGHREVRKMWGYFQNLKIKKKS